MVQKTGRNPLAWFPRLLYQRTILVLTFMFVAGIALTLFYTAYLQRSQVNTTALAEAARFTDALAEFRTLYTSEVVVRVQGHGVEVTHDYATKEGAIPLPATLSMLLGERIGEASSGASVRLFSDYPFPWRTNGGPQDDFERQAIDQLRQNADQPFFRFEESAGHGVLRYATADLMRDSCINCHNTHPDSPKTNWKVGDVRGVLEITLPLDAAVAQTRSGLKGLMVLLATLGVMGLSALAVVVRRLQRSSSELARKVDERTAALRESEARIRAIVDAAADAVITIDERGVIDSFNQAAERLFGYTAEEVIGQSFNLLMPSPHREQHDQYITRYLKTGEKSIIGIGREEVAQRKDGTTFPVHIAVGEVKTGNVRLFTAILSDRTERKRAEQELEAAKAAAEAANQSKSEFLASMSHELRTPLSGVIGMTEILLDTDLDDRQGRYASLIKSSGDALLSLINDILDFSKIEAGKLELETIDFDLQNAVESVATALASKADAKELELVASVHPEVPPLLRGDPGRLQQILLNLANNAIKFTKEGEVVIRATREQEAERAITVRFTVSDTGIGIPTDSLDRLFESFSQVDASTTRNYGGTGLGLAISKQLVELMGGRIGVESEPSHGSTFWFTVEFEKQADGRTQPRLILEDLRHVRILAVDDNATNREILHEQLTAWDLAHEIAADGKRALALLRDAASAGTPFGVTILDMQMPGMDGGELAQAIKADPLIQDTVLILLTSVPELDDEARIKTMGFAGCLSKPVRQSQLLDAIAEAVACAQAPGARVHREMQQRAEATKQSPLVSRTAGARILVAEDHPISQEVAVTLLAAAGYHCDVAANGRQVVEAVQRTSYDLILMDCQMPEMDGFEATRTIRRAEKEGTIANDKAGRIPIIALTANAVKGDRERCLEAGMDDYLTKPLDPDRFIEVITAHLRRADPEPAAKGERSSDDVRVAGVPDAPSPEGWSAPIDGEALFKRWSGHQELVHRMLMKFEAQAGADLERIEQSVGAGDAGQTERLAHGLKGAAGYIAAGRVQELAAELEAMGRDAELSEAETCFNQLRDELSRCLEYIPRLLEKVGGTERMKGDHTDGAYPWKP
ncbi:MAG: response regulator [Planctomycetes bacterium]|nr:response regulator [Planctomycetota bacterium]